MHLSLAIIGSPNPPPKSRSITNCTTRTIIDRTFGFTNRDVSERGSGNPVFAGQFEASWQRSCHSRQNPRIGTPVARFSPPNRHFGGEVDTQRALHEHLERFPSLVQSPLGVCRAGKKPVDSSFAPTSRSKQLMRPFGWLGLEFWRSPGLRVIEVSRGTAQPPFEKSLESMNERHHDPSIDWLPEESWHLCKRPRH